MPIMAPYDPPKRTRAQRLIDFARALTTAGAVVNIDATDLIKVIDQENE